MPHVNYNSLLVFVGPYCLYYCAFSLLLLPPPQPLSGTDEQCNPDALPGPRPGSEGVAPGSSHRAMTNDWSCCCGQGIASAKVDPTSGEWAPQPASSLLPPAPPPHGRVLFLFRPPKSVAYGRFLLLEVQSGPKMDQGGFCDMWSLQGPDEVRSRGRARAPAAEPGQNGWAWWGGLRLQIFFNTTQGARGRSNPPPHPLHWRVKIGGKWARLIFFAIVAVF